MYRQQAPRAQLQWRGLVLLDAMILLLYHMHPYSGDSMQKVVGKPKRAE